MGKNNSSGIIFKFPCNTSEEGLSEVLAVQRVLKYVGEQMLLWLVGS